MSTLFSTLLIAHVIMGVIGAIGSYAVVLFLLRKEIPIRKLKIASLVAYISYFTSWLTGGYYYWFHYGSKVKPIIKAGDYVWAHNVVMEAKEHVFFLLPTLTFVIALIVFFASERLITDATFKSRVVTLASVTLAIAIVITLSGIIISGGAQ